MQSQTLNPKQNPELQEALDRVSRAAKHLEALFQDRSEDQDFSQVDRRAYLDAAKIAEEISGILQG